MVSACLGEALALALVCCCVALVLLSGRQQTARASPAFAPRDGDGCSPLGRAFGTCRNGSAPTSVGSRQGCCPRCHLSAVAWRFSNTRRAGRARPSSFSTGMFVGCSARRRSALFSRCWLCTSARLRRSCSAWWLHACCRIAGADRCARCRHCSDGIERGGCREPADMLGTASRIAVVLAALLAPLAGVVRHELHRRRSRRPIARASRRVAPAFATARTGRSAPSTLPPFNRRREHSC